MSERWILQFCHCHYGPFLDVARQYAVLFAGSRYKVLTVYLTGKASEAADRASASDEVIFLNFSSKDVSGLKLSAILALRKIAATRDFALVVAHRFKPIYIACLATRLPVIGVHHAFGDYKRAYRRWFVTAFRERLSLLGVSNAVRDDIRKELEKWPTERIQTMHNHLDVKAVQASLIPRREARARLGLPDEAIIIGNVGRLHADKDQATLIDAFAIALPKLPAGSLLAIAGSGPLEEALRAQVEALSIVDRVCFLGQVPLARRYFSAFDLFVLSSDHEPFGMVLLEAMAADVPVMATNCGGAAEVIGEQDLLFEHKDSRQLAKKLVCFFDGTNTENRAHWVRFLSQRLEAQFSDQAAQERFLLLIERLSLGKGS